MPSPAGQLRAILLLAERSEAIFEALDATAGVQSLLLTGVERVALVAYVGTQWSAQGRTSFELVTAAAGDCDYFVIRVNFWLHGHFLDCVPPPNTIVEYRT